MPGTNFSADWVPIAVTGRFSAQSTLCRHPDTSASGKFPNHLGSQPNRQSAIGDVAGMSGILLRDGAGYARL
jgi:hypothetical protein